MSEKHNHSLSSINSLLEKKNHCIMIVSFSNEMITYVNQQTEEKDTINIMQSLLYQTSLTWDKIADFFFFFIVRFTLRREDRDLKNDKLC